MNKILQIRMLIHRTENLQNQFWLPISLIFASRDVVKGVKLN